MQIHKPYKWVKKIDAYFAFFAKNDELNENINSKPAKPSELNALKNQKLKDEIYAIVLKFKEENSQIYI